MAAYYNEFDKQAAQWLRNLIAAGLIAPGDVDDRSILDVSADDLRGYTQCHFFAGIGVWSLSLRQAGWPDDRPVWTGSCPCQPFSSAGEQTGFADERHLWPYFFDLIEQCRPPEVFGEQVASKAADPWIDLVQADLEGVDYSFGCIPFPSAGVGAPHIRDRTFWVGYTNNPRLEGYGGGHQAEIRHGERALRPATPAGESSGLADNDLLGFSEAPVSELRDEGPHLEPRSGPERLADREGIGRVQQRTELDRCGERGAEEELEQRSGRGGVLSGEGPAGPTNGFWGAADWLFCRDEKWRPVEPGTFPLADGAAARVVRLRAYGNAINAEAATEFIKAYLEAKEDLLGSGFDLI